MQGVSTNKQACKDTHTTSLCLTPGMRSGGKEDELMHSCLLGVHVCVSMCPCVCRVHASAGSSRYEFIRQPIDTFNRVW